MGGGVAMLINQNLRSRKYDHLDYTDNNIESCFIEVDNGQNKILIGLIYRPPNSDSKNFMGKYKEIVKLTKGYKGHRLIGMDHNVDFLKTSKHVITQNFIDLT